MSITFPESTSWHFQIACLLKRCFIDSCNLLLHIKWSNMTLPKVKMMIKHEFDSSLKWNRWFFLHWNSALHIWALSYLVSPPDFLAAFCFLVPSLMQTFFSYQTSGEITPHSSFLSRLCLIYHFLQFPNPPFSLSLLTRQLSVWPRASCFVVVSVVSAPPLCYGW